MDQPVHDFSLNLDSSGTHELGRTATVQGEAGQPDCVEVPEKIRKSRCETRHRELLGHTFAEE